MTYKVNYSENNNQKGRKPSNFRVKVNRTLAVMEPKSTFTVWNKVGMTTEQLQKTLSVYLCSYQDKNWGKRFSTKKYSHGVKVTRVF